MVNNNTITSLLRSSSYSSIPYSYSSYSSSYSSSFSSFPLLRFIKKQKLLSNHQIFQNQSHQNQPFKEQVRFAKMWVIPTKKTQKDLDSNRMFPLLDSLRLIKATQVHEKDYGNISLKFSLQPVLKKEVNANVMKGRLFLPKQLPTELTDHEQNNKELIAIIWNVDKDRNRNQQDVQLARDLGVDLIGGQELIDQIVAGHVNPTKLLCHPDLLHLIVRNPKIAKNLGQRGLIPSEKRGTVSSDLTRLIQDAKGALDWIMDPHSGLVTAELGKLSMDLQAVEQNVVALVDTVGELAQGRRALPRAFKSGRPIKRPGIRKVLLDVSGAPQIIAT